MRTLVLCISCIMLFLLRAEAQYMQPIENAIQLSDKFDGTEGRLTLYAENRDFCPYYLFITFTDYSNLVGMSGIRSLTALPGNHSIASFSLSDKTKSFNYKYNFSMFRGNPNSKINIDFAYALPTNGHGKIFTNTTENRDGYQLMFELPSDTIYACREGIVCNDDLRDHTAKGHKNFGSSQSTEQITLYHNDNSFGEYIFKGKSLIYPGQKVKMGTPIAITESSKGKNAMYFSTYFLDKNKIKEASIGNKHTHFRPFFQTANAGKLRLERETEYVSELTDEMLMQDMNKRELKKFLKARNQP